MAARRVRRGARLPRAGRPARRRGGRHGKAAGRCTGGARRTRTARRRCSCRWPRPRSTSRCAPGKALLAQGSTTVPPFASARSSARRRGRASRAAKGTSCSTWRSSASASRPASPRASGCARPTRRRTRRSRASPSSRSATRASCRRSPDDDRRARLGADRRDAGRTRGQRRAPRAGERRAHRAVGRRALRLAGCGAARRRNERVSPEEEPVIDVVVPTVRATAYLEVDDAKGRAWAAAIPVRGAPGEMPRATVRVPQLAPGLYWAVEAGDPVGRRDARARAPWRVPSSSRRATRRRSRSAPTRTTCAPPARSAGDGARRQRLPRAGGGDARAPVDRARGLHDAARAGRGEACARAGSRARRDLRRGGPRGRSCFCAPRSRRARSSARVEASDGERTGRLVGRAWTVGVGLLVAMLGFALLAAFLARVG